MSGFDYLQEPLTGREIEILVLLAEGMTNREIGENLFVAQETVKWYNRQIYSKLGVHSRSQAVSRARELGLLEEEAPALTSGTVTFLFTDVVGSTKLWERHPDAMGAALQKHDSMLHRVIRENNGRVFKTVGDAFHAVFDDALEAISAAYTAQKALMAIKWAEVPIQIRIALHTGTAQARDNDYFGPAVNHVARLLSVCNGEQILVSATTCALTEFQLNEELSFRDLGAHRLKDLRQVEKIYQLVGQDLPDDFPALKSLDSYPLRLPTPLTSFVGRQLEIEAVNKLLTTNRLLTLSGPPGTGKTRLALHVARQNADYFRDGTYFVDLAPIDDPGLVLGTLAQVLDLKESPTQPIFDVLVRHLCNKQILLVLDSFEQVVGVAPVICDLLSACPKLTVLVTSREPLRVYGEQEYPVPPLALPDAVHPIPAKALSKYEAVDLFCQRARAVKPDFRCTEENAQFIGEITLRLDGLPLAIELAAARSKLLSPEDMCSRLESRLMTLTQGPRDLPERLQTLRAAIDWSYNLLDPDEQRLFDRLSVFQGGRTFEALETVCGTGLSKPILDVLESLLNKNLLSSEEGRTGETRFVMLATIHEYARERLERRGEAEAVIRTHAAYFTNLAEQAEEEFQGVKGEYWSGRLTDELDNFRTIFNRMENESIPELGARLLAALREYLYWTGLMSESSLWIERVMETETEISPSVFAKCLNTASRLAYARGSHTEGEQYARQALFRAKSIGDDENSAWAYIFISNNLMYFDDQIQKAISMAEEGLFLFRELNNKLGVSYGLNTLGELARLNGQYDSAGRHYQECLALSREMGDRQREAMIMGNLSYIAYHKNNFDKALKICKEAISLIISLKIEYANAVALSMIAGPIAALGDNERAARLLGASQRQLDELGVSIQPADKMEIDDYQFKVRKQLGDTEYRKAFREGWALSKKKALAEALA